MPAFLPRFAVITLFALLAGCASLSEQDCLRGDWQQVGFRDGQTGRPPERLDSHRKACEPYGVTPQEAAYRAGRERGLNFYCTPANGLAAGRRGEHYAGVCPEWAEPGFLRSFEAGRDVYAARDRLDRIEQDIRRFESLFYAAQTKEEQRYLGSRLMHLRIERDMAWSDLRRREFDAERLKY